MSKVHLDYLVGVSYAQGRINVVCPTLFNKARRRVFFILYFVIFAIVGKRFAAVSRSDKIALRSVLRVGFIAFVSSYFMEKIRHVSRTFSFGYKYVKRYRLLGYSDAVV